ncbi:molybdopterin molybdotransferase MoeA [Simplicispira psychrophila]|uniref:molybdopterin molybdotransferase MoeA n=1 Tax=Simplicispira psychrophila TaxID=80882 RepID=UPI000488FDBC|nr:molybdopterin-binding protein [Simplicispira psychrophila]
MTPPSLADLAAALPCDPLHLRADQVTALLAQFVQPLTASEDVGMFEALGRVLACDVVSPLNVPPHDNSAMDGYAFAGNQLVASAPLTLRVVGKVLAGATWTGPVATGECIKIMTGAALPAGLDTVVPQELTRSDTKDHITLAANLLRCGDNRRRQGEDLVQGGVALQQGALLTPAALGLIASLGLPTVAVVRRLRVAYFSTGNEILSLGEPPRAGAVYDSNRYTLFGLLTRLGVQVIDLGVVPDAPAQLEAALVQAANQADAIITSGGASAGEADHLRSTLPPLGDAAFWRINIRPGRPLAVGRIDASKITVKSGSSAYASSANSYKNNSSTPPNGPLLFGLPGNPVAAMVSFLVFVRPALLRLMGCTQAPPPLLRAVCTEALRKNPGRTEYQRGWVSTASDGTLQVRTTGPQGSGVLSSMVQANGLIVLAHEQGAVAVGEMVSVMLFDGVI